MLKVDNKNLFKIIKKIFLTFCINFKKRKKNLIGTWKLIYTNCKDVLVLIGYWEPFFNKFKYFFGILGICFLIHFYVNFCFQRSYFRLKYKFSKILINFYKIQKD